MKFSLLRNSRLLDTGQHTFNIVEPTIYKWLELTRTLFNLDSEGNICPSPYLSKKIMLEILRPWLIDGDLETITDAEANLVLDTVFSMVFEPVISSAEDKATKKKPSAEKTFDINLLKELSCVGYYYKQTPQELSEKITLRQLHYLYWLAYNQKLEDLEEQIALNGGKLKKPLERLTLLEEAAYQTVKDTTSMTPKQKAAYYSRLRRAEGREPGKLKA